MESKDDENLDEYFNINLNYQFYDINTFINMSKNNDNPIHALGMKTVRIVALSPISNLIGQAATNLAIDFMARVDAFPSGTAPHAIVHACMCEFGSNKAWIVAPHTYDIIATCKALQAIIDGHKQARNNREALLPHGGLVPRRHIAEDH